MPNVIAKILLGFAFRLLLFALCPLPFALYTGCHSTDQPTPAKNTVEGPDQEGWNSTITVTSNGRVTALVKYRRMEKFSKKRRVFFKDSVAVDFYNQQGQHSSKLTADGGVLYEETNDVVALGNVVVVSDSGVTLRSDSLRWDSRRQKVLTEAFVTITRANGETLRGLGFESDPNLKHLSIKKASGLTPRRLDLPSATRSREVKPRPTDSDSAR
ncbi:MAG: LPS export ABC transporter periplasmic protein LptC [bacterium]